MPKEQYILGIQGYSSSHHSASACLIKNGELIAMAEQDRFSRKKNQMGEIPHDALAFCLVQGGVQLDDIDIVGLGYDLKIGTDLKSRTVPTQDQLTDLYFPRNKFKFSKKPRVEMVGHHLAHAASTFFMSGYNESAILIIDGQGESQSTSLYYGRGDNLRCLSEFPVDYSLGYFYNAVSRHIGFGHFDAGKTMGLAGYGRPTYDFTPFEHTANGYKIILPDNFKSPGPQNWRVVVNDWRDYLKANIGPPNDPTYQYSAEQGRMVKEVNFNQREKDIAASAQLQLENTALHLLGVLKNLTGSDNLCLAGGVALNCSMNGRIMQDGKYKNIFIPPVVDDAGVGLGAALYLSDKKPTQKLEHAYYGPSFNNAQIKMALDRSGVDYESSDDIATATAKLLSEGQVVSWFQGRLEIGPRALGNRSILADPGNIDSSFKANNIKNREHWRPLAPSFLAEKMSQYVEGDADSPFMIKAYPVNPQKRDSIPAVVHVDGTLRPQSVNARTNPLYHRLILDLETITGIPAVLNTSFNLDSEPIVCTPFDAIRSFFSSGSNVLAIGDFLIRKSK